MTGPSIEALTPLTLALRQFETARAYMLSLIDGLSDEQWYWMPNPPICHIAWQIGHVSVAQYGLMLFRQRGRLPEDAQLMPSEFRKLFMKGSIPQADSKVYPRPDEILAVLHRVNEQALREAAEFSVSALDEPTDPPHAGPPTRLGSLLFAAHHEMLHAGQIGMLRRQMGLPSLR
jgi:hypothetical protein